MGSEVSNAPVGSATRDYLSRGIVPGWGLRIGVGLSTRWGKTIWWYGCPRCNGSHARVPMRAGHPAGLRHVVSLNIGGSAEPQVQEVRST